MDRYHDMMESSNTGPDDLPPPLPSAHGLRMQAGSFAAGRQPASFATKFISGSSFSRKTRKSLESIRDHASYLYTYTALNVQ